MEGMKPSEEPIEVWEDKLFVPLLIERKFLQEVQYESVAEMKKDRATGEMPPEYKKRKPHQGPQRKFHLWIKQRKITVLTSHSWKTGQKKASYYGWVSMEGKGIRRKLWSFPILNVPSFFETVLGYVDAFIDMASHWPKNPINGEEFELDFLDGGFVHMMKFEPVDKATLKENPSLSFLITEGPFSKKTLQFLKRKFMPSYRARKKIIEESIDTLSPVKVPTPKRFQRAHDRKKAFTEGKPSSSKKAE